MSAVRYPMKVVTQRTGLSSHVVRVWERRYGAVTPDRSDGNRRLYSEEEVRRLSDLAALTNHGHSISQIAELPSEQLRRMVADLGAAPGAGTAEPDAPRGESRDGRTSSIEGYLAEAMRAVEDLDAGALEDTFDEAAVEFGGSAMIENLIVPLIGMIGAKWDDGTISVAHEHAASSVIKEVLLLASRPHSETTGAPDLAVATPTGQLHELGAALVACTARRRGWSVTYLGPSLPADEIVAAARQRGSRAIALSIVYPGDDPGLPAELRRLRRMAGERFPIVAGGRRTADYADVLDEIGAQRLDDLQALKRWLDRMRECE